MVEVTTKMIGTWFKEEFEALDRSIPLKERRRMAGETVGKRISEYKRLIALDNFLPTYPYQQTLLKKIWDEELGEH